MIPMAEKHRAAARSGRTATCARSRWTRSGRATGAVYFDAARKEVFQRAKAVVVCCNGAETPRLLLMSKSNRFPDGLANSSGLVGKYLMFDTAPFCERAVRASAERFQERAGQPPDARFLRCRPEARLLWRRRASTRASISTRSSFALCGMPPDAPRWGAEYKRMLREYFTRTMYLLAHSTSLPVESNSISLDPEVKDAWGLPAMRVTYKFHPDDLANMQWFLDAADGDPGRGGRAAKCGRSR